MSELKFRDLTPDDVDVRVAMCNQNGASLLVYKDARVDQDILDETVGPLNWKKTYEIKEGKLLCIVSIWDETKKEWIPKEDVGTESNTEKEKGAASDAQKRACFVWGIGRELYTVPRIWVNAKDCEIIKTDRGSYQCRTNFKVSHMKVENKKIVELNITNSRTGVVVFSMKKGSIQQAQEPVVPKKTVITTVKDAVKAVSNLTSSPKPVGKKPSLKDCLDATYTAKDGKIVSLQQTIDCLKTKNDADKFKEWLRIQANDKTCNIATQCEMVYIACARNVIELPTAA